MKQIKSILTATALSSLIGTAAHAIPADPSTDPLPPEVLRAIPDGLQGYLLLRDNTAKIVYVAPRYGVLANQSGQPFLSLAEVNREGVRYGVLNAAFDFAVDKGDFTRLKNGVESVGWAIAPIPFESTSGTLSLNSFDDGKQEGICGEVTDPISGETVKVCSNFVIRSNLAPKGPTLGQLYNVQLILTGDGVDLYQKLLIGGNGISFNMEANYQAAFPAYTAKIDVNYKKLSESYEAFAAIHFSNCLDIQVSDFFKREALCAQKPDGSYESLNGGACSIKVSYTNQRGEAKQNLFKLPENYSTDDLKQLAKTYNEDINYIHNAIEGLRLDFERKMLEKYPTASVDKNVNYNFVFRADRKKYEEDVNVTLERKTVGAAVIKSTTIPGIAACVNTNAKTGEVKRYNGTAECVGFWKGETPPIELLERTDEETVEEETDDGWFT
ncbi:hypothetical protein [Oligoflexus tunisiensis]|uniref:hypothetical protein n=1 Tax=Oligoflexus tunisiensis TaxID=708132 RepID=UPI00114D383D|nr:hypothetical protein [Oligoflexus tunisiensis]